MKCIMCNREITFVTDPENMWVREGGRGGYIDESNDGVHLFLGSL
jgi:hypothetical protein